MATKILDKGNSESFKIMLVQKFIMNNVYFDDAVVPLTMQLLKDHIKTVLDGKGWQHQPSLYSPRDGWFKSL